MHIFRKTYRTTFILWALFTFVPLRTEAVRLGALPGILRPESIAVTKNRLYILEEASVFVFSLNDLRLIAKIGGRGDGPGEIQVNPLFPSRITVDSRQNLIVETMYRLIFFSEDYHLRKEIRKSNRIYNIVPVNDKFAALHMIYSDKAKALFQAISLFDQKLETVKELYRQPFNSDTVTKKQIQMVQDSIHFAVHGDKIFVEQSDRGFSIGVFDHAGNFQYRIGKNIPPLRITEKDRQFLLKRFQEDTGVRFIILTSGGWDHFKKTMKVIHPEFFPAIKDILVYGNRIYLTTFSRSGEMNRFLMMDLTGENMKETYIPFIGEGNFFGQMFGKENRLYDISRHRFYYLEENEEAEEWEIHFISLENS